MMPDVISARAIAGTTVGTDRALIRQSAASPEGRQLAIPIVFAVIIFVTGFAFGEDAYGGISVHLLDLGAGLAAIVPFLVQRTFLAEPERSSLRRNMTLWAVAGVAAVVAPVLITGLSLQTIPPQIMAQLPFGLIAYPALLTGIAVLFSNWRFTRKIRTELRQKMVALTHVRETLSDEILRIDEEMRQGVQDTLQRALSAIPDDLAYGDPVQMAAAVSTLHQVIDDVVRPLSSTLAAHDGDTTSDVDFALAGRPRDAARGMTDQRGVSLARVSGPWFATILSIIFVLPSSLFALGLTGLLCGVVTVVAEWIVLTLLRRFGSVLILPRLLSVAAVSLICALVALLFVATLALWGDATLAGGVVVAFTLIGLATALFLSFVAQRADAMEEILDRNDDLAELLARLRQELWLAKRSLAKVVHGQVQSKLLVAALRLSHDDGDPRNVIAAAQEDIAGALRSLSAEDSPDSRDFNASFQNIEAAWKGVCEIRLSMTAAAEFAMAADSVARACVVEVIQEAVANAAKHSQAPHIDVTLTAEQSSGLGIVVSSPGKLDARSALRRSLGSTFLDEATTRWTLAQQGDRVELRAHI